MVSRIITVVLLIVFGLVSDFIGVSYGRWTYSSFIFVPIAWMIIWSPIYFIDPELRAILKIAARIMIGFVGVCAEFLGVATGFLIYQEAFRPADVIRINDGFIPTVAVIGWPFTAFLVISVATEGYDFLGKRLGSKIAFLLTAINIMVLAVILNLAYISSLSQGA